MARSNNNLKAVLQDTADAIRAKTGSSSPIVPRDFADEIESIQSGGGGSGSDIEIQLLTGQLTSYTVPSGIELRSYCFYYNNSLKEINLNQAKIVPYEGFKSCWSLSRAVGNEIRAIGYRGFAECAGLAEVSFPKLVSLAMATFSSCSKLTSIYFPELVYTNEAAFSACYNITDINCPNLLWVSNGFVANCSSLANLYCPNLLNISGTLANQYIQPMNYLLNLDLPNFMILYGSTFANLNSVSSIRLFNVYFSSGSSIFRNCYNLENLSISFGYGTIYQTTFQSCYKLPIISFPLACLAGAASVFYNCSALSQVTIGLSYGGIGQSAFYSCSSLESLFLLTASTSVPQLQANAFNNTPMSDSSYLGRFGSIYVPSAMVASFKAATNWIAYSNRITALPSEYDSRFAYAWEFYNRSDLTAIPSEKSGAEYVLSQAFKSCTNLETINLPNCKSIGEFAFETSKVATISLPNCEFIGSNAFCPSTIHMSLVTSLDLPKVKVIADCFIWASNVQTINIPECIFIGSSAFSKAKNNCSYVNCPNVKYIDYGAFSGMSYLASINLPECLFMSNTVFSDCKALENVSVPKLKMINGGAFYGCKQLSSFSAPELAFVSGNNTFAGCTKLNNFYAPKLTNVVTYMFQSTSLASFDFDNIVEIGASAFAYCGYLKKVNLAHISYLHVGVFANCIQLSKALLQQTFFSFTGGDCFSNCQKLESVYMFAKAVVNMTQSDNFRHGPMGSSSYLSGRYGSIYVPASLVSNYQNHSVWSWYSDRFVGLTDEEMQSIIDHWDD